METGFPAAPDKPYQVLAAFFKLLLKNQPTGKAAELFLATLGRLPPEQRRIAPVLADMARLRDRSPAGDAANALGERLSRRYRRICFVQEELGRLDFSKAQTGEVLESFVFNHIDFSYYKKIEENEFSPLFIDGPEDYGEPFFEKTFHMNREGVKKIITGHYQKIGGFYYLRRENPLILSIMRSLHASLEFLPLFSLEEIRGECAGLVRALESRGLMGPGTFPALERKAASLFPCLIRALDGLCFSHGDGQKTSLSCASREDGLILEGIFRPQGKPYTVPLVRVVETNLQK
jgi:hypothetical protein